MPLDPLASSALEAIDHQVDALFEFDAQGRMTRVADTTAPRDEWPIAPRFFLARTAEGVVWRIGRHVDDALAAALDRLARTEPALTSPDDPSEPLCAPAVRALLHVDGVTDEHHGPVGIVPPDTTTQDSTTQDTPTQGAAPRTVLATPALAEQIGATFTWTAQRLLDGASEPIAVAFVDGRAVSICTTARWGTHAAEAGVDTLESHRSRGLAVEVTRVWAAAVRTHGRLPLYSTEYTNQASRRVAARLGVTWFGDDWSIT